MHVRHVLPVAGLCISLTSLLAQAPGTSDLFGCQPSCATAKGPVHPTQNAGNVYLRAGAQLGYTFASRGGVDDVSNFFAGRAEIWIDTKSEHFKLPIIGNLGKLNLNEPEEAVAKLQELANSAKGIQVALAPYYMITPKSGFLTRVDVFGNLGGKFNRLTDQQDTSKHRWATQFRVSLGLDLSIKVKGERPVSLIFEPVYGYLGKEKMHDLTGRDDSYVFSFEATVIAPVPSVDNWALLAQRVFIRNAKPIWRIGTIVFAPKKKEK
jgi:hypothetical protein